MSAANKTARPKIKRLDLPYHLYFHGVDLARYDATIDANMQVITDVPVLANDGWFLACDGKNMRSWFQIKGRPCVTRKGCDRSLELNQEDMIRKFKSCLYDEAKWENELGREATDLLARSLRCMRKVPDSIYGFMHEQRGMQYIRDERRNMTRRMRSFRERRKSASAITPSNKE